MRIFNEFPKENNCIVCKSNENKKCVLIAIEGTNIDGGMTHRAEIVHLDCIKLRYEPKHGFIYQKVSNW